MFFFSSHLSFSDYFRPAIQNRQKCINPAVKGKIEGAKTQNKNTNVLFKAMITCYLKILATVLFKMVSDCSREPVNIYLNRKLGRRGGLRTLTLQLHQHHQSSLRPSGTGLYPGWSGKKDKFFHMSCLKQIVQLTARSACTSCHALSNPLMYS